MSADSQVKLPSIGYSWYVVMLLALLYVISYADRLVMGILVDPIKADLGVTDTQMGLLLGFSFAALYAVLALVLARVADRHNRRNLITIGVLIWSVMTSASAFADSFWELAFCRLGVGIGEAALGPAALSIIADLFKKERRHLPVSFFLASGVFGATGAFILGGSVVYLVSNMPSLALPLVGELAPWRLVFLTMGIPGIIMGVIFLFTVREPARINDEGTSESNHAVTSEIIAHLKEKKAHYLPIFVGLMLVQMVLFAMAAWYPSVLIRDYGYSIANAGISYGVVGLIFGSAGAIAGPYVAGVLERRGREDALLIVSIAMVLIAMPAAIWFPIAPTANLSLVATAVMMFCLMASGAMAPLLPQLIAPSNVRAQTTALYFFLANVIGLGLAPFLIGVMSDVSFLGVSGIRGALSGMAIVLMPIALVILIIGQRVVLRDQHSKRLIPIGENA